MATAGDLVVNLTGDKSGLSRAVGQARGLLGGFVNSLGRIGLAAGGAGAIIGGLKKLIAPVKLAADIEKTAVSFEVLTGSASNAKILLNDIQKFAASTPFQFPDLATAGKKLIAFGTPLKDVVPDLRKLGNLAAGLDIPIGELAEIFGKARVQGRLFGEDVNQLTGRGIPVIGEFAKQFGVSTSEVKKLVEQGKIGFPQLQTAITNLTTGGGKFAGLIEKQSGTLSGLWSTLKDNVNLALTDIGRSIVDTFDMKAAIQNIIGFADTFRSDWLPAIQGYFKFLKVIWDDVTEFFSATWQMLFGRGGNLLGDVLFFFRNMDLLFKLAQAKIALWGTNLVTLFRNIGSNWLEIFRSAAKGIAAVFGNLFTDIVENAKRVGKVLFDAATGRGFRLPEIKFDLLRGAAGDNLRRAGGLLTQGFKDTSPEIQKILQQLADREAARQKAKAATGKLTGAAGGQQVLGGAVKQGPVEGAVRGTSEFFKRLTEIRSGDKQDKQLTALEGIRTAAEMTAENTKRKPIFESFEI